MSNEIFFRVVHSFAVTLSIQFFARPDVTVTIDQAAMVECHFILVKVEGLAGYFKDPTTSPPSVPRRSGLQDNAFIPVWFRFERHGQPSCRPQSQFANGSVAAIHMTHAPRSAATPISIHPGDVLPLPNSASSADSRAPYRNNSTIATAMMIPAAR